MRRAAIALALLLHGCLGYESRDGYEAAVVRAGRAAYECVYWEPVDSSSFTGELELWVCPDCVLVTRDPQRGQGAPPFWETCSAAEELRDACEDLLAYPGCWSVPL